VLVPAEALALLCKDADPEAVQSFGRRLGVEVGRRAAEGLNQISRASIEAVVERVGAELALMGLGSLAVERWGRALVCSVSAAPLGLEADALVGSVLEGVLEDAFGRAARAVPLGRVGEEARFLIINPNGAIQVDKWLAQGSSWGQVLERLHTPKSQGEP
jgi:hypothetical protein